MCGIFIFQHGLSDLKSITVTGLLIAMPTISPKGYRSHYKGYIRTLNVTSFFVIGLD